jgi:hypothetical protein
LFLVKLISCMFFVGVYFVNTAVISFYIVEK